MSSAVVRTAPAANVARTVIGASPAANVAGTVVAAAALADMVGGVVGAAPGGSGARRHQGRGGGRGEQSRLKEGSHLFFSVVTVPPAGGRSDNGSRRALFPAA
jgi:hypothetical protein